MPADATAGGTKNTDGNWLSDKWGVAGGVNHALVERVDFERAEVALDDLGAWGHVGVLEDHVGDVLHHALDALELVLHAVDFDR